ncbi:MAG: hypothetical protein WA968_08280 [Castellaniella sp.]
MLRPVNRLSTRLLGLGLVVLLGACAQQREPGYYDSPRESTASDAMQRAQGGTRGQAPAQLQLGFGQNQATDTQAAQAQTDTNIGDTPAATETTPAQASSTRTAGRQTPDMLADTRTYLGTVACTAGAGCAPNRLTLTLAPDGQWRARMAPVDQQAATTAMGCWFLTGTAPVRIVLQAGQQTYASLSFASSNVLQIDRLNGQVPLLTSRLTRQADLDPIAELADKPAQPCPAS